MTGAGGRRDGLRGAIVAAAGLAVVAAGALLTIWLTESPAEPAKTSASAPPGPPPTSDHRTGAARRLPRVKDRDDSSPEPEPDRSAQLLAEWNAAAALMKAGKPVEALVKLSALRRSNPEFFADP